MSTGVTAKDQDQGLGQRDIIDPIFQRRDNVASISASSYFSGNFMNCGDNLDIDFVKDAIFDFVVDTSTSKKAKSRTSCKTFLVTATDGSTTTTVPGDNVLDHYFQVQGDPRFDFDMRISNGFTAHG